VSARVCSGQDAVEAFCRVVDAAYVCPPTGVFWLSAGRETDVAYRDFEPSVDTEFSTMRPRRRVEVSEVDAPKMPIKGLDAVCPMVRSRLGPARSFAAW